MAHRPILAWSWAPHYQRGAGGALGRMEDALEAVRKARGPDGRWTMKNSYIGKMLVDVEKKGEPSKWITLGERAASPGERR